MIPILYDKNEKSFKTNGIGRLSDAIRCTVTEVRNGEYSLEMDYPATGKHFDSLAEEQIIYAKPNDGDDAQPFSIFRISKPINGIVTVSANHISYLLNKMVVMPFTADTCQEALGKIPANTVGGTNFTFWTDKSVSGTFKNDAPRLIRGMLGGEQNSILQVYGKGEYEFDHFAVKLHVNRGADRGVTMRYGKNITNLENTLDMSNVYTGIVPYWKSEDDILTLPEKVVWSNYTGVYAYNIAKAVDFSSEWQDKPTVAQLRERAQKYVTDNEGWVLPHNVTVSFVHLADTEEYKDIAPMERVRLCDTVTIIDTPLGVNIKAKVIKTVYNTLLERYTSVEIGDTRPNLMTVIEEQIRDPIVEQTSTRMQQAIKYATDLITGAKGGYLLLNDTDGDRIPDELLIMNNPDKNLATQVLRINQNGIGFGKSYVGPFATAWTLDGHFVANYIDTGTLNADLIRTGILRALNNSNNYWNMQTGEFHLRSNGAATGIDFKNGVLAINASNITTGFLSADRIRSGILSASNGHSSFNLNNGELSVNNGSGTVAQMFDGYLKCSAKNWQDVIVECDNSRFNNVTVRQTLRVDGTSYLFGTVYVGSSQTGARDVVVYGSLQTQWNVNAAGDVSGTHLYGQLVNGSDRKRKRDIETLSAERALDFIMALLPRTFAYLEGDGRTHHGFVAQEVEDAMEGDDWSVYQKYADEKGETCGIAYTEIIADLVAVVQKQQKQIEELENRIIALEENR